MIDSTDRSKARPERSASPWRRARLGVALLAFSAAFAAVVPSAHAYRTLAEEEGTDAPIVWSVAPTVSLRATPGLTPERRELLSTELEAAVAVWNAVDCTDPLLSLRASATAATPDISIETVEDWAGAGFGADATATTEVALATMPDGTVEITSAVIYLDASATWVAYETDSSPDVRDARAVLVHELGHALGLLHPCEVGTPVLECGPQHEGLAMHPVYFGAAQATLAGDDTDGYCFLYAASPSSPGCAGDAECPLGAFCIEEVCRRDMRYGGECTDGSDCLGARCVSTSEAGTCSYVCESNEECPAQTTCARVSGRPTESVCAPLSSVVAQCSASPGARSMPVSMIFAGLLLALLSVRRRFGGPTGARLLASLLACSLLAGCGTSTMGEDAGADTDAASPADSGEADAGPTPPVDSGPEPECEPGAMGVGDCGFCGTQARSCGDDGRWTPTSECLGQGECGVGTVEMRDLELCAQEQRICLSECSWGGWESVRDAGVCVPGETRRDSEACAAGEIRDEVCDDTCAWVGTSACENPCGVVPRSMPEWEREVCVPAGNFVRGSLTYANTQPVSDIYLPSYLIDAYPVTNRRYMACVAAAACTSSGYSLGYDRPERLDYAIQGVTRRMAVEFCTWDGGRRLPTEAEWEKAARGPSPRTNAYLWDTATWDCSRIENFDCGFVYPTGTNSSWAFDPYDGLPGSRSYYGTYLQMNGVGEMVADYYLATAYGDSRFPPSDPFVPRADSMPYDASVVRGSMRPSNEELAVRFPIVMNNLAGVTQSRVVGFRCVRDMP